MVFFLLLLLVFAGFNWYLVFNERARRKFAAPGWYFYKRSKKGRELDDSINLATALIAAVFCSTILISVLIVALIIWLK